MMRLQQLVLDRRGHWPERAIGPTVPDGSLSAMDRALKRRLEARFGERLLGPVRQRHDETEIRIAPGDVPEVMRALHDEPEFRFESWWTCAGSTPAT